MPYPDASIDIAPILTVALSLTFVSVPAQGSHHYVEVFSGMKVIENTHADVQVFEYAL